MFYVWVQYQLKSVINQNNGNLVWVNHIVWYTFFPFRRPSIYYSFKSVLNVSLYGFLLLNFTFTITTAECHALTQHLLSIYQSGKIYIRWRAKGVIFSLHCCCRFLIMVDVVCDSCTATISYVTSIYSYIRIVARICYHFHCICM